mgnify:CR=1 FL=1
MEPSLSADNPTREIGGTNYRVQLWPTTKAMEWIDRLTKLLGQPFVIMLASGGTIGLADRADEEPFAVAFAQALRQLGDAKISDLIKSVIRGSVWRIDSDGKESEVLPLKGEGTFDVYYRGRISEVFGIFMFVIEEHLGDFISGLRSSVEGLLLSSSSDSSDDEETKAPTGS